MCHCSKSLGNSGLKYKHNQFLHIDSSVIFKKIFPPQKKQKTFIINILYSFDVSTEKHSSNKEKIITFLTQLWSHLLYEICLRLVFFFFMVSRMTCFRKGGGRRRRRRKKKKSVYDGSVWGDWLRKPGKSFRNETASTYFDCKRIGSDSAINAETQLNQISYVIVD